MNYVHCENYVHVKMFVILNKTIERLNCKEETLLEWKLLSIAKHFLRRQSSCCCLLVCLFVCLFVCFVVCLFGWLVVYLFVCFVVWLDDESNYSPL